MNDPTPPPPAAGRPPQRRPERLADLPRPQARLCLDVEKFLARDCGLDAVTTRGATWLVACSGGPDSLVLLQILLLLAPRLGLRLEAAHLDHGLRPGSGAEAARVRAFCRDRNVPCHLRRTDVAAAARTRKLGLEDAGRAARYGFFADLLAERPGASVALGHQLNDLAEDQLMRLSRGTGWPALGGMAAVDAARHLVRPLLLTPRRDIEAFAAALGLPVVRDPTNDDPAFLRNRVRHGVLSQLCAENVRYLDAAARLWRQARLDEDFIEAALPALPDPAALPMAALAGLPAALRLRLYRRALAALGPGQALGDKLFALDAAVARRDTGRVFQFPGGKTARIDRLAVVFGRERPRAAKRETPLTGLGPEGNEADCEKSNMEAVPVNILTFGPNGSGKGTQGSLVKKKYNLAHIESGAIFREHIGGGTELGKKAKAFIDKGELVPDDITIPMILETLKAKGGNGWLLDGFPRNMVQAEKLWEALQKEGMKLDYVIEILLPREIAKNRIMGRRLCVNDPNHPNNIFIDAIKPNGDKCRVCGGDLKTRSDDQDEAAIGKRHDIYYDTTTGTMAAAYFYKDLAAKGQTKYIELNGEGSIDSIKETLLAQLA
uniref:Multifunctional fusion protein n=1 Tax=Desulfovibrio sp. U5L TaxID=596152 RepID=I2Q5F9_9BACT